MSEAQVWQSLTRNLEDRVAAFEGAAGVALLDLRGSQRVSINAEEVFPTASTIKIAILAHLLELAHQGVLDLSRRVVVDASHRVPGSGVLNLFEDPVELTMRDVAVLMIDVSDNVATNLCIDWSTPEGINEMLRRLGLRKTTLRRKMQDEDAISRGDENVATPAELVELLRQLFSGEGLSGPVCAETLRILRKPKHGMFQPGLPEDLELASKPGAMSRVRNDAAVVYLPRRPYVLCVMSAWGPDDRIAQERFVAGIAGAVHQRMATLDATSVYGQGLPPP
ncbi:MAG: serine hydrolase [Candidatus Dormibacteraceae bacterium]